MRVDTKDRPYPLTLPPVADPGFQKADARLRPAEAVQPGVDAEV